MWPIASSKDFTLLIDTIKFKNSFPQSSFFACLINFDELPFFANFKIFDSNLTSTLFSIKSFTIFGNNFGICFS